MPKPWQPLNVLIAAEQALWRLRGVTDIAARSARAQLGFYDAAMGAPAPPRTSRAAQVGFDAPRTNAL